MGFLKLIGLENQFGDSEGLIQAGLLYLSLLE